MSVEIKYIGNCGNHAFQYFTCLIYCIKNNLKLDTRPSNNLLNIFQINVTDYPINDKLANRTITRDDYDKNNEISYYGKYNYIFHDYFQNTEYINNNYMYLLKNIKLVPCKCNLDYSISDNDILCILRLGDFKHSGYNSEVVHPNYFIHIFKQHKYTRMFFLIYPGDDLYINRYLSFLKDYNIIILKQNSILYDFNLINNFKNIALTNSTFNWWSAFFCQNIESKTIFIPKSIGYFGIDKSFKCHGTHIKNLWNIRNMSIPIDNKFFNINHEEFI